MLRSLILSLTLIASISTQAKTLLISDIDDTIKIAHIRSFKGKLANAFRTSNIFKGMSKLYKDIQRDGDAEIVYLTNAPQSIMGYSHRKLLRTGNFPAGTLLMRQSGVSSMDHKRIALNNLMKEQNPDTVILFGDNGEHDIRFYNNIKIKYPNIKFITFIRIAYDLDPKHTPINGQYGFISPFEVATKLHEENILTTQTVDEFIEDHALAFLKDKKKKVKGKTYLPKWMGCKGHSSKRTLANYDHPLTTSLMRKVQKTCR